ncbi:MAG TPA: hypothetical protein VFD04_04175 [Actinomycetes bacterium]|nr:hypothetical protein [Actinomycetes bacterium]
MPRRSGPGRLRLVAAVVLAAVVLLWPLAQPAAAGRWVDQTASRLRDDPVYVAAGTGGIDRAATARLRARAAAAVTPVYLAVLPSRALAEAAGDPDRLAASVAAATGFAGTYLVVAGGRPGAGSSTLPKGQAAAATRAAFRAHRGDLGGAMLDFVRRVDTAAGGPAAPARPGQRRAPASRPANRDLVLRVALGVMGLAVLVVAADVIARTQRGRRRVLRGREFDEARRVSEEDLRALGEDLRNVDVDLRAGQAENTEAVRYYSAAYEAFERAVAAFERARSPADIAPVSTALEASRYSMVAAQALFERRERPRRRPPCFFDTRHGPSVDDVGWEAPGGPPRPVPACPACMAMVASGVQPPARTVRTGGRTVPFYEAPAHFEPWFGGYFGGAAADLVAGFELGRALDDGFAGGINTFGGGYGYMPVSFADTGTLDKGGATIGDQEAGVGTMVSQEDEGEEGGSPGRR